MGNVVCPLSSEQVNRSVVRLTGLLMAGSIAVYLYTGNISPMVAITADYYLRAFTSGSMSPFSSLAAGISSTLGLPVTMIDKAPKIFAARVGFLFAWSSAITYIYYPDVSQYIAFSLMCFALLESVFNFCFGCVVYQYIMLPMFGPAEEKSD